MAIGVSVLTPVFRELSIVAIDHAEITRVPDLRLIERSQGRHEHGIVEGIRVGKAGKKTPTCDVGAVLGHGINRPPTRAGSKRHATLMEHTRRFGVFSVRSLLSVWVSSSLATLGYAYADLSLTPGLHQERGFSIHVDIARIGELWHWGGRLLNEGAIGLLVLNAIMVGGFLALLMLWIGQLLNRVLSGRREAVSGDATATTSVAFGSIPPPAG